MLLPNLRLFVLFSLFHFAKTHRRIKGGKIVEEDKRYVAYMVKAPMAPREYDSWLCGGAVVSESFIVTSAACVEDVQNMYAIAGYKKYVPSHILDRDQCTQIMKRRITFTCVPKSYELDFARVEKWAYIDIAAVKVETPFDFDDKRWSILCSFQPMAIEVNYDTKYQEPGTDSMVFGWGHLDKWRKPEDPIDYNQKEIRFASTLIHDKEDCKKFFAQSRPMAKVIDKYMICTLEAGNIDEKGNLILKNRPVADGCTQNEDLQRNGEIFCEEDETVIARRKMFSNIMARQQNMTRRQGFCQNDHGGPLVTWVGTREVLIGIASVFRITKDSLCTGPFLYTSTQCNGAFLSCIINSNNTRRNEICNKDPSIRGFDQIETHISWVNYSEGSDETERHQLSTDHQLLMMDQTSPVPDDYTWYPDTQIDKT